MTLNNKLQIQRDGLGCQMKNKRKLLKTYLRRLSDYILIDIQLYFLISNLFIIIWG